MTLVRVNVIGGHIGPEIGGAIVQGLSERGLAPQFLPDGAAQALDCDVILLAKGPSSQRQTVGAIRRAGAARPAVAAWLFEPLPPPDLPREAIRGAVRFSALRTGRRWMRPVMRGLSWPLDVHLARRAGRSLTASNLRFLVDNASFAFLGSEQGWLDAIFVSTEQKRRHLADWGIGAHFLPVGQQPSYGRDLGRPRDIDVLFVGSLKAEARRRALADLMAQLQAAGLVTHVPDGPVWGQARTDLVNRARIMLHMHQFDWDTPWMRWCLAAANGAVIASEPLTVAYPLVPGRDYLEAPAAGLADAILALLRDEDRRRAMLASCRAALGTSMAMDRVLDDLAAGLTGLARGRGKA